jgi:hypothetical protein
LNFNKLLVQPYWRAALGEPVQASAVGQQALDLTVRLTSARSVPYVGDLVRTLRPRAGVPAVRDFTAEVRERLAAAAALRNAGG